MKKIKDCRKTGMKDRRHTSKQVEKYQDEKNGETNSGTTHTFSPPPPKIINNNKNEKSEENEHLFLIRLRT